MKKSQLNHALFTLTLVLMLAPFSQASLTDGLVAYYPLDGNADDQSSYGNDGTVYGATWTGGYFGGALSFDGIDDYVRVSDSDSLDVSGAMTIAAWIMSDSTAGPRDIVSKWDDNTSEHSYIFKDHNFDDTLRIELITSGGYVDLAGTSSITTGNWIHVAITFDSTAAKLYYNGVEDGSVAVTDSINSSDADLLIGAVFTGGGILENFDGLIDEVYIYNRALSASEIQTLAREGIGTCVIPAPGAILLGGIGVCLVGWARRRRVF